jgi:hypothetical protein
MVQFMEVGWRRGESSDAIRGIQAELIRYLEIKIP